MSVTAKVTDESGREITLVKRNFVELADWMEKHYGEFVRIDARLEGTRKIRQGREKRE